MGRMALVVGILAVTLSTGWGPRERLGAADSAREPVTRTDVIPQANSALQGVFESPEPPAYVTRYAEGLRLWKQTRTFYEKRQFAPAWIDNGLPRPQMDALISAIHAADREGLDPELYNAGLLDRRRQDHPTGFFSKKRFDANEAGVMDACLTYLYIKYTADLIDGISDLAQADSNWKKMKPAAFDPLDRLERALNDNRVAESLAELTPEAPAYRALRTALAEYRGYAARGGWPTVPAGIKVKPGQVSVHVPAIARRLAASGDYPGAVPADDQPAAYTSDLQEAVKRFSAATASQTTRSSGPQRWPR